MEQHASNACGTVAALHSIANIALLHPELVAKQSFIEKFLNDTKALGPEDRGKYLKGNKDLEDAHKDAVQQGESFVTTAPAQFTRVTAIVQRTQTRLQKLPVPPSLRDAINDAVNNSSQSISDQLPGYAQTIGTSIVTGTGGFLISIFLITLVSFGLMLEAQRIRARLLMLVPPMYRRDVTEIASEISSTVAEKRSRMMW